MKCPSHRDVALSEAGRQAPGVQISYMTEDLSSGLQPSQSSQVALFRLKLSLSLSLSFSLLSRSLSPSLPLSSLCLSFCGEINFGRVSSLVSLRRPVWRVCSVSPVRRPLYNFWRSTLQEIGLCPKVCPTTDADGRKDGRAADCRL